MSKSKNTRDNQCSFEQGYVGAHLGANRVVDISRLKDFVDGRLPVGSPLREVILCEDCELDLNTFLARLPVWLKLSRLEKNGGLPDL